MKYTLYIALAVALLMYPAAVFAQEGQGDGPRDARPAAKKAGSKKDEAATSDPASLKDLKHTISFLNLLNGLNLTQEQLDKLIKLNKKYGETAVEYEKKYREVLDDEKSVLSELEEVVRQNKPIPKKLENRVHKVEERSREVKRVVDETNVKFIKTTESIFTEEQMEVIEDFEPCTIPPKNLSDPVRVGQASDNERVVSIMRRIRQMPQHMFDANLDGILDKHMEHLTKKKRLSDKEKQAERERLKGFLNMVRNMEEVEFEINKDKLAEDYKWKDQAKELRKELDKVSRVRHPNRGQSKAARYFLDPKIIPVLEERLEKARGDEGKLRGGKRSGGKKR